jgi:hypothetical protein
LKIPLKSFENSDLSGCESELTGGKGKREKISHPDYGSLV